MTDLVDRTGAPVTVALDDTESVGAYTVAVDGGGPVGSAQFVDAPDGERIFFHTEVPEEFGGRGLGGLLVRAALADSIRTGTTVVPVCPLFARHLRTHGEQFVVDGGAFRAARPADLALVRRAVRAEA